VIRVERDPVWWTDIASHPAVIGTLNGVAPATVGSLAARADIMPLASEHGGFMFVRQDAFGFVCELHTLFTPEGWGREVAAAAKEAFNAVFLCHYQAVVTLEVRANPRSQPPRSYWLHPGRGLAGKPGGRGAPVGADPRRVGSLAGQSPRRQATELEETLMPIALIAAAVGAAGVVGGALINSSAASNASNIAAQTAAQDNALQQQTYESNKALIQPAVDRGNAAGNELNGFLGLGGDPAATQAAFNTYLNSTGYQFNRQQGLDAVNQSKASQGLFNSGSTLEALDNYATGEANQYGQQYATDLSGVANTGEGAVNALTGVATGNANAQSSNNAGAANVAANAAISSAASTNGLIGNAFTLAGQLGGGSSFGASSFGGGAMGPMSVSSPPGG